LALNEDYDVQLRLREGQRNEPRGRVAALRIAQGGGLVRLDNVVRVTEAKTASRIDRLTASDR